MRKVNIVLNYYLKQNNGEKDYLLAKTASNLKKLLSEMDLKSEVVPEKNLKMLTQLLTSLKGSRLNANEQKIVKEIIEYNIENNEIN